MRGYHHVRGEGGSGGGTWMVAGRYEIEMEERAGDWTIAGMTLRLAYQEGALDLPATAQARVAAGQGRATADVSR